MGLRHSTTVTILSAGASIYLARSIDAILRADDRPTQLTVIWSGKPDEIPSLPSVVSITRIPQSEFDHGATRQLALDLCTTDLQVFLSDDAEPTDGSWLRELIGPFDDGRVLAVYGRQIARPGADMFERAFRGVKYPAHDASLGPRDAGIIAAGLAPVSDANAAYRSAGLWSIGGFPERSAFAEDVDVALRAIQAGWCVRYASAASVWHSHAAAWRNGVERGWKAALTAVPPAMRGVGGSRRAALRLARQMLGFGWRERGAAGALAVAQGLVARAVGKGAARVAGSFGGRSSTHGSGRRIL